MNEPVSNIRSRWRSGLLVAGAAGGIDAVRAGSVSTLDPGLFDVLVLIGGSAVLLVLMVAPVLWIVSRWWPRASDGLALVLSVALLGGERWFADPAPHTMVPAGWGNPVWFGVAFLLALGLAGWLDGRNDLQRRGFLALLGCVTLGWIASEARPPMNTGAVDSQAPNVLVVSIDTIRADYVGAYGAELGKTPAFDRLTHEGVRFDAAHAQAPVTGPSHATVFSGHGPWRHGVLLNGVPIPEETPWLPERLAAQGYRTGAFVSAYVLDGALGFARGFGIYDDDFNAIAGWGSTGVGRILAMARRHLEPRHILERRGDGTVDRALAWLDEESDQPFFAWVHLFDPHGPYAPPAPWDQVYYEGDPRDPANESMSEVQGVADYLIDSLDGITDLDWVRAQYAGEISFADAQLGRLLDALDATDRAENTLVVVVGDHGESLGEGGVWFNHGGDLEPVVTRVPLAMRWPGTLAAGATVTSPVELTDLAPTIAQLADLSAVADSDGVSLVDLMATDQAVRPYARSLCYDRPVNQAARAAGEIDRPTHVLVALDSEEARFTMGTHSSRGAQWQVGSEGQIVDAWVTEAVDLLKRIGAPVHERATQRTDASVERLKALGYVE